MITKVLLNADKANKNRQNIDLLTFFMQSATGCFARGGLLACKRASFRSQKATFRNVKDGLLENKGLTAENDKLFFGKAGAGGRFYGMRQAARQ
jgi:hypothetical protein